MILGKIIAIILAFATILCLATWIASKKEHWGIATIINIIAFAAVVVLTKFYSILF